jgi:hypothetical protein
MTASMIIFAIIFVATFLIHKPFNVHAVEKRWVQEIHHYLEITCVVQGLIILNLLFW